MEKCHITDLNTAGFFREVLYNNRTLWKNSHDFSSYFI